MSRLEVAFGRYDPKRVFAHFETCFRAFAVLFFVLFFALIEGTVAKYWKKRVLAGFKTEFTTFTFFFEHFGGIFSLIGGTVAKILEKRCVRQL